MRIFGCDSTGRYAIATEQFSLIIALLFAILIAFVEL